MTVDEVVERIDRLNGRTVSVVGYLSECGGYDCVLYRDKTVSDEWHRYGVHFRQNWKNPPPSPRSRWLGIGTGTNFDFDANAAPLRNSYIVVTGRITNECRIKGVPACLDRTTDIEPTDVRRASKAPNAQSR